MNKLEDLIKAVQTATKMWLTPPELQEEFGISLSTQSKMRVARKIPYHKISKYVRYKREDINKMFDDGKVA